MLRRLTPQHNIHAKSRGKVLFLRPFDSLDALAEDAAVKKWSVVSIE